jgi:hypothetical protein
MPISDDLRQAMSEGRLGREHIVFINPEDFRQLRTELIAFDETPDRATIYGFEVFATTLQDRGSIRIIERAVFAPMTPLRMPLTSPPSIVVHPSNVDALHTSVDGFRLPIGILTSGAFSSPIFIPGSDLGEVLVAKATPDPKTLWELLDEDDE